MRYVFSTTAGELRAITLEGLKKEDELNTSADTWEGVDAPSISAEAIYNPLTGTTLISLSILVPTQIKPWTIARLTSTSNQKHDNSIIRKLARIFLEIYHRRRDLLDSGSFKIRFVSNQPIDPEIIETLKTLSFDSKFNLGRKTLLNASELSEEEFSVFAKTLDFSESGSTTRANLELEVVETVATMTQEDSRATVDSIRTQMRRLMLPEGKRGSITLHTVLHWFGISDINGLLPCPARLQRIPNLIIRDTSKEVVRILESGNTHVCIHGEGGVGKSSALQEIEGLLPEHSVLLTFDCYGNGEYLDSNAYRHRSPDAFQQLCNELAVRLRIPLLIAQSRNIDFPKVFMKRLISAAKLVEKQTASALLIIAVDAADNSIVAAQTEPTLDRHFVLDFLTLGEVPSKCTIYSNV